MTFSAIQLLIVVFAAFAITRVVIRSRARDIPLVWALVWIVLWLGAAVVSVLPQTTDLLAARVGIGRGADLLVYVSILALFYLVFRLVVKIETMQQEITKLVRSLALKDLKKK
ncbi:hypothetical protein COV06_02210 [Candidatus Uhrbacteria bacterium CG10_big_fil_rev_8_21_14_0_10_50_16]|uniref:DUF2304 domain-containing protein n=1 Tax=Candidatus Uhrbacteria bacterium CG10_big_fil_rev_8_21_14_0_10_50_16 TaxID=1975039 RepID=A0A2H0RPI4_9BACT|nr:MAG: hypothetical protein COV06_02210 [Candidatus Uhrbacteria bacterium CG10_big_fil_rev_8_21_14_0_10_50_16]